MSCAPEDPSNITVSGVGDIREEKANAALIMPAVEGMIKASGTARITTEDGSAAQRHL